MKWIKRWVRASKSWIGALKNLSEQIKDVAISLEELKSIRNVKESNYFLIYLFKHVDNVFNVQWKSLIYAFHAITSENVRGNVLKSDSCHTSAKCDKLFHINLLFIFTKAKTDPNLDQYQPLSLHTSNLARNIKPSRALTELDGSVLLVFHSIIWWKITHLYQPLNLSLLIHYCWCFFSLCVFVMR